MKTQYFLALAFGAGTLALGGCTDNANTNVSRNASNSNVAVMTNNTSNTNAGTGTSVTNSIANAVDRATTDSPEEFMKTAAVSGMTEVELGKLAATKATNPEVKKFAQMMVTDHTKANTELKALAAKKNVTLPTQLDSSTTSMMNDMKAKSGAGFDGDYVDQMVDDHDDAVALFQAQADKSADPDVKAFAAKTLPTLKAHQQQIKAIKEKM